MFGGGDLVALIRPVGGAARAVLSVGAAGPTGAELGLAIETTSGPHDDAGHVQVARLRNGMVEAASDPRADGLGDTFPGR